MKKRKSRPKAFAKFPTVWAPVIGDVVYVRRFAGDLSWQKSVGVVIGESIVPGMFVVAVKCANRKSQRAWRVEDLRPCIEAE